MTDYSVPFDFSGTGLIEIDQVYTCRFIHDGKYVQIEVDNAHPTLGRAPSDVAMRLMEPLTDQQRDILRKLGKLLEQAADLAESTT
jgi:GMP synthase PP-ATPase subunit